MSIVQTLRAIADPTHTLTMTELRVLSDLGARDSETFWSGWQKLPTERRREVLARMVELADDNVDLNFSTVLQQCLHDSDATVRTKAAEGLWEDESPRTLRRLLPLLTEDPAAEVRAATAVTLGRFAYMAEMGELDEDDAQALQRALVHTLDDQSQPVLVRRRALESAGYFAETPQVERAIEQAFGSHEVELRESALVAMGRSMQPRWLKPISASMSSDEAALRYQAARAAGEFADEGTTLLKPLLPLLEDDDSEVVLATIWALGQIGGPQARKALEQISTRNDETQRQAARAALVEMSLDENPAGL